jgi:hypothetical protein
MRNMLLISLSLGYTLFLSHKTIIFSTREASHLTLICIIQRLRVVLEIVAVREIIDT